MDIYASSSGYAIFRYVTYTTFCSHTFSGMHLRKHAFPSDSVLLFSVVLSSSKICHTIRFDIFSGHIFVQLPVIKKDGKCTNEIRKCIRTENISKANENFKKMSPQIMNRVFDCYLILTLLYTNAYWIISSIIKRIVESVDRVRQKNSQNTMNGACLQKFSRKTETTRRLLLRIRKT